MLNDAAGELDFKMVDNANQNATQSMSKILPFSTQWRNYYNQ
jgi:hypothetical protein